MRKITAVLFLLAAASIMGCYSDPVDHFNFEGGQALPGTNTIATVVLHSTVETPGAFAQFPDGGSPRIKYYSAKFYVIDISTATIRNAVSFSTDGREQFSGQVDGFRGEDTVFVSLWPCSIGQCFPTLRRYGVKHYMLVTGAGPFLIDALPNNLQGVDRGLACKDLFSSNCFKTFLEKLSTYNRFGFMEPLFETRMDNEIELVRRP